LLSIGHSKLTAVLIMYTWTVVISVGLLLPLVLPMRSVYLFWVLGLMFAVLLTFAPLRWRPGRHRKDSDAHSACAPRQARRAPRRPAAPHCGRPLDAARHRDRGGRRPGAGRDRPRRRRRPTGLDRPRRRPGRHRPHP